MTREQTRLVATTAAGLLVMAFLERVLSGSSKHAGESVTLIPGSRYRYTFVFNTTMKGIPNDPSLSSVTVSRPNEKTVVLDGTYQGMLDQTPLRLKASTPLGNYERIVRKL